jgi:alpha-glucosidase (family GH31 glycosyl hydrolase)
MTKRLAAYGWVLAHVALLASLSPSALAAPADPAADPKAMVVAGPARFTLLTSQMVRLEWDAQGHFEDRPSLVFLNRHLPVPVFKTATSGGWLTITTDRMTVRYRRNSGKFTPLNLEIRFTMDGRPVTWKPGTENAGNLLGTTRTLDGVKGATKLEQGLLSRNGWVLIDDTSRLLFDDSDWPWLVERAPGERQDLYFMAYGHDYRTALGDFTRVAGKIPMPPRFAFGAWWSRYWAYTDQEFKQLVGEFESHGVPLDVLVVDMDWHLTFTGTPQRGQRDQANQSLGWTGFTWDPNYFPDPAGFLAWCDAKGLKTPLNVHPASGIQPHEAAYPAMAQAMGIDPATKQYVPFDIVNKRFATNFLDIVIRPLERQGVDFWWLDWQQGDKTKIAGINPTWWLNYVFFTDMERRGEKRPLLFHRWGGLGNHRYQIGFSGDTYSTWDSLAFQPYFTATAANVGFGYWSHDIGGHMPGTVDPELYTRWVQFGAFSPILRTHTTKNPAAERRIWAYPPEFADPMRDAFLLRYSLIPYLYTASRQTYDSGVSFFRPMYYDYPDADEAYAVKEQYLYGNDLLVAPVVSPRAADTKLAAKSVWLPPGGWVEWFSGATLTGPATVERQVALNEIPVYVKSGAIIPMQPPMRYTGERPVDPLILTVFPGAAGSTRVYEDQGNSIGYQKDECAWTPVSQRTAADGTRTIEILPAEGTYPGMITARGYEIRLAGLLPPQQVAVNGRPAPFSKANAGSASWTYDGDTLTTTVTVPPTPVNQRVDVIVKPAAVPADRTAIVNGWAGRLARLRALRNLVNGGWSKVAPPDLLINMVQAGTRITLKPETALTEIAALVGNLPALNEQIGRLDLKPEDRIQAAALLKALQ